MSSSVVSPRNVTSREGNYEESKLPQKNESKLNSRPSFKSTYKPEFVLQIPSMEHIGRDKFKEQQYADFNNISNINRNDALHDDRFWIELDNEETRVHSRTYLRFLKLFSDLRVLDQTIGSFGSDLNRNLDEVSFGEDVIPTIGNYASETKTFLIQFKKKFEQAMISREKLMKRLRDIEKEISTMSCCRSGRNLKTKEELFEHRQRVIDFLVGDNVIEDMDYGTLRHSAKYLCQPETIVPVQVSAVKFMTKFKDAVDVTIRSSDEVKMSRWLAENANHTTVSEKTIMLVWDATSEDRGMYETNLETNVEAKAYVLLPKLKLKLAAEWAALEENGKSTDACFLVTTKLSSEGVIESWGYFFPLDELNQLMSNFLEIRNNYPDQESVHVVEVLRHHFMEPIRRARPTRRRAGVQKHTKWKF